MPDSNPVIDVTAVSALNIFLNNYPSHLGTTVQNYKIAYPNILASETFSHHITQHNITMSLKPQHIKNHSAHLVTTSSKLISNIHIKHTFYTTSPKPLSRHIFSYPIFKTP